MTPGSLLPGAAAVIADDPHSQTCAHYLGARAWSRAMARLQQGRLEHDRPPRLPGPGEAERLTGIRGGVASALVDSANERNVRD